MQLSELNIEGLRCIEGHALLHQLIAGIASDSRKAVPGSVFFAVPGVKEDGARYIHDAAGRGAIALVLPEGAAIPSLDRPLAVFAAADVRRALSQTAGRFYARQPQTIAAVTGTDGKTSVAHFTRQLLALAGRRAYALGTIGMTGPEGVEPRFGIQHTTPDPVGLHQALDTLTAEGCTHLVMEASSHGLDQYRLDGVRLAAAGFTNLSRDHLDYHGTVEAYFQAKARLFTELLPESGMAVINADDPWGQHLQALVKARGVANVITYGIEGRQLTLKRVAPTAAGMDVTMEIFGRAFDIALPLAGYFQAHNVACAMGLALAGGLGTDEIVSLLPRLTSVRGRLERVAETRAGAAVFVDYAHTPNAVATALRALRGHTQGRLVIVFGCGGDRDRGKRPEMARMAGEFADRVIITDDNPRSENPAAIRAEVRTGFPAAEEIGDRREAIAHAVNGLERGDVLLVAGKGHETTQTIGDAVLPFDDAAVVRECLGVQDQEKAYG